MFIYIFNKRDYHNNFHLPNRIRSFVSHNLETRHREQQHASNVPPTGITPLLLLPLILRPLP